MGDPISPPSESAKIDTAANRNAAKWTTGEQFGRLLWALVTPFFLFSPRIFWEWRVALLRCFGATIGRHVHIYPSVRIAIPWNIAIGDFSAIGDRVNLYSLAPITIGKSVTVSQNAHLCAGTHDHRDPTMPLLKQPISIEDGAWICADAFIGPKVTVEAFAIVGARAVVIKNVQRAHIVVGNRALTIGMREIRSNGAAPYDGETSSEPPQQGF